MNIIKFLYSKTTTKRKILDVIDDLKIQVKSFDKNKFWIFWFGAYKIHPECLVIYICVKTDAIKFHLNSNPEFNKITKEILVRNNYPQHAIPLIHIGVESKETVDRESEGDWFMHFK